LRRDRRDGAACPGAAALPGGSLQGPRAHQSTQLVDNWQPWKVLDASMTKPASTWMSPSFDDSNWLNKRAVLGNKRDPEGTILMQRPRYA